MRTALVLLFLLALAAVPGSVVPQENIDAVKVANWKADHPTLTPVYETLGLFNVYGSVWFSAIYILLMVSLVGCVVPRLRVYWRAMRAQPPPRPAAPRPAAAVAPLRARRGPGRRCSRGPRRCCAGGATGWSRQARPTGRARPARGVRGEGVPARGRQPAVPLLGAGRAGRLRGRPAVRLQGRRDHRSSGRASPTP